MLLFLKRTDLLEGLKDLDGRDIPWCHILRDQTISALRQVHALDHHRVDRLAEILQHTAFLYSHPGYSGEDIRYHLIMISSKLRDHIAERITLPVDRGGGHQHLPEICGTSPETKVLPVRPIVHKPHLTLSVHPVGCEKELRQGRPQPQLIMTIRAGHGKG